MSETNSREEAVGTERATRRFPVPVAAVVLAAVAALLYVRRERRERAREMARELGAGAARYTNDLD
jgi:hypothetical protein